jgi:hypothetical protein
MNRVRGAFVLALCLSLWACSDGSQGLPPSNPGPSAPASNPDPGLADPTPAPSGPVSIVLLEKGTVHWPLGTWIDGRGGASFVLAPTPGEDGAVRFSFTADQHHDEIFTHDHFNPEKVAKSILIRAKASEAFTMLVGITLLENAWDYWSELAAGKPWRVADVPLQTDWSDIEVPLSSLQAKGAGEPQPMADVNGFVFAFLLTDPGAIDVWFEHIEMK